MHYLIKIFLKYCILIYIQKYICISYHGSIMDLSSHLMDEIIRNLYYQLSISYNGEKGSKNCCKRADI